MTAPWIASVAAESRQAPSDLILDDGDDDGDDDAMSSDKHLMLSCFTAKVSGAIGRTGAAVQRHAMGGRTALGL